MLRADFVVLVQGPPWSPRKHTEPGLAIGAGTPVYPILDPWPDDREWEPDPASSRPSSRTRFANSIERTRQARELRAKLAAKARLPFGWRPAQDTMSEAREHDE